MPLRSPTIPLLATLAAWGCEKAPGAQGDPSAASASSKAEIVREPPPPPAPTAPAADALAFCKTVGPDDPLGVVCKLGAPALEARFDCDAPEPLLFCKGFDEWSCRYLAIDGKEPPPTTYRARFDHDGPPVKIGETFDEWPYKRSGIVRGVSVHVKETDDARGLAKAAEWSAEVTKWGCVSKDEYGKTKVFSCGTWEAVTTYNEIIDDVIFEAALEGYRECEGP